MMFGRLRTGWSLSLLKPARDLWLLGLLALAAGEKAIAQAPPSAPSAIPHPASHDSTEEPPRIVVDAVEIRPGGTAGPGDRVLLRVDEKQDPSCRYYWEQIEGPPVAIGDRTGPSITITLPEGAERVAFHLIASRRELTQLIRVVVPIGSGRGVDDGRPRADAGDDQIGLVGYRVTLNGAKSRPADGRGARWIQVAGPPVVGAESRGGFHSFIPPSTGVYRFLLVVARGGEASEPDEVVVVVGTPPPGAPIAPPASDVQPVANPTQTAAARTGATPEEFLRARLPHLADSPRIASDLADVMQAVAQKAALYESFESLQGELVRRLDVVIPSEANERKGWIQGVFQPLTAYTAASFQQPDLDLRTPEGLQRRLTPAQQEKIRNHFLALAQAFRNASKPR